MTMTIAELFTQEFDQEVEKTRPTLERVPSEKKILCRTRNPCRWAGSAALVAQLPEFGVIVLTTPALDFATGSFAALQFESAALIVKAFDEGANKLRATLAKTDQRAWAEPWKADYERHNFLLRLTVPGVSADVSESSGAPPRAVGRVSADK